MRKYNRKNLMKDVIAGMIIMAVSIPISMGYAQIAGLPAVYGLYGIFDVSAVYLRGRCGTGGIDRLSPVGNGD